MESNNYQPMDIVLQDNNYNNETSNNSPIATNFNIGLCEVGGDIPFYV